MSIVRGRTLSDAESAEARTLVTKELARLDSYSFWVVPTDPELAGDLVVAGTTGVFLIAACGREGHLKPGRRPTVGDAAIRVRPLRGAAKRLGGRLSEASVFAPVQPVMVVTHATAGPPTSVSGVRFVHLRDIVRDLTGRSSALSRSRAQRAARVLGMQLAGDQSRHFTAHR
jgi:hypothetical protein